MPTLDLTGQNTLADAIRPRLVQIRNAMLLRQEVWNRLPPAKRKKWVLSDKDPIMALAWDTYKFLKNNFFELEDTN